MTTFKGRLALIGVFNSTDKPTLLPQNTVIVQADEDLAMPLSSHNHKETPDLFTQTVLSTDIADAIDDSSSGPQSEHLAALFNDNHTLFDVNASVLSIRSFAEHRITYEWRNCASGGLSCVSFQVSYYRDGGYEDVGKRRHCSLFEFMVVTSCFS